MDDFLFSDEPADVVEPEKVGTWKVIIVDDERSACSDKISTE